jgi:hypothetical protein
MWVAMKRPSRLILPLLLVVAACGDDGDTGPAALVAAFPDDAFVGRSTTLILVGENTAFTDASTVDFGEGITVISKMQAGDTGLIVEIEAGVDAALGARPITVDGNTLADGLTLAAPIEVEVLGTPAQGSFSILRITNLDLLNPFDLTADPDTGEFTNLAATITTDGSAVVNNASAFELEIVLQLDVNAAAGAATVEITSDGLVSQTSVDITARTPMTLAAGTTNGSVANGFDSVLYEVPISALSALFVGVPDTKAGSAFIQILGSSGSFDEPIGAAFNSFFGPANFSNNLDATVYVILWDGLDAAGYDYSFDVGLITAAATINHAEPNDAPNAAQAVVAPGGVLEASFTGKADEDWYSVVVAAGDVGKVITASTGGVSQADPVIEIFAPNGTTSLAGPEDAAFFDRLSTEPITAAGTYFVKISSSDFGPTIPDDSAYTLVIALE